jgi:hypothetical protein
MKRGKSIMRQLMMMKYLLVFVLASSCAGSAIPLPDRCRYSMSGLGDPSTGIGECSMTPGPTFAFATSDFTMVFHVKHEVTISDGSQYARLEGIETERAGFDPSTRGVAELDFTGADGILQTSWQGHVKWVTTDYMWHMEIVAGSARTSFLGSIDFN